MNTLIKSTELTPCKQHIVRSVYDKYEMTNLALTICPQMRDSLPTDKDKG
jgi:hypothetical protein